MYIANSYIYHYKLYEIAKKEEIYIQVFNRNAFFVWLKKTKKCDDNILFCIKMIHFG